MLTLGQAARHCGVAKGTISKAIKAGKLSVTRREDGSWCIYGAELSQRPAVPGRTCCSAASVFSVARVLAVSPATFYATKSGRITVTYQGLGPEQDCACGANSLC